MTITLIHSLLVQSQARAAHLIRCGPKSKSFLSKFSILNYNPCHHLKSKLLSQTTTNFGSAVAGDLMWPSLRHLIFSLSSEVVHQWTSGLHRSFCSSIINATNTNGKSGNVVELLNLEEVNKILSDVRADDVRVIPVRKQSEFTHYVVVATGRSQWHVRNIAQALIYKVKQKQTGAKRMLLPSVEGQEGGNWIVIDSVHALDEKARAYYNLEQLWTSKESTKEQSQSQSQELGQAFVKVRLKNNSKKPQKECA